MDGDSQQDRDVPYWQLPSIYVKPFPEKVLIPAASHPAYGVHTVALTQQQHVHDNLKRCSLVAVVLHHGRCVSQRPVPGNLFLLQVPGFFHPSFGSYESVIVVELDSLNVASVQNLSDECTYPIHRCWKGVLLRS